MSEFGGRLMNRIERLEDEKRQQAEEIERLRAENTWLKEAVEVRDAEDQRAIDTLKAEVERLRAEKDEIHATGGTSYTRLQAAKDEVEELKALLREAREDGKTLSWELKARIDALLKGELQ